MTFLLHWFRVSYSYETFKGGRGGPLENLVILSSKLNWSLKPVLWKPVDAAASYRTREKFIWECFSYTPIVLAYTLSAANHLMLSFFSFLFLVIFPSPFAFLLLITFYLPVFPLSPTLFLSPSIFISLPHDYSTALL